MKTVRHFGIVVSDMERSLRFYRDILGLRVVRVIDESGAYIDNILALRNVRVTTVKLAAETGPTLVELLEFRSHPRRVQAGREAYLVGPSHVAFTVSDLDALYRRLCEASVTTNAPPQLSPDGYAKLTYCQDPDGTLVELVQVLDPSVAASPREAEEK